MQLREYRRGIEQLNFEYTIALRLINEFRNDSIVCENLLRDIKNTGLLRNDINRELYHRLCALLGEVPE
jgi:hypothetical protein